MYSAILFNKLQVHWIFLQIFWFGYQIDHVCVDVAIVFTE